MRKLLGVLLVATLAAPALQAQSLRSSQGGGDLRTVLRQAGEAAGQTQAPRRLSEEERAELRRQLSQQGRKSKGS
jgi:hypothetical protein